MNTGSLKMLWRVSVWPKQARLARPSLTLHTLPTLPRRHLRFAKSLSDHTDRANLLFLDFKLYAKHQTRRMRSTHVRIRQRDSQVQICDLWYLLGITTYRSKQPSKVAECASTRTEGGGSAQARLAWIERSASPVCFEQLLTPHSL